MVYDHEYVLKFSRIVREVFEISIETEDTLDGTISLYRKIMSKPDMRDHWEVVEVVDLTVEGREMSEEEKGLEMGEMPDEIAEFLGEPEIERAEYSDDSEED